MVLQVQFNDTAKIIFTDMPKGKTPEDTQGIYARYGVLIASMPPQEIEQFSIYCRAYDIAKMDEGSGKMNELSQALDHEKDCISAWYKLNHLENFLKQPQVQKKMSRHDALEWTVNATIVFAKGAVDRDSESATPENIDFLKREVSRRAKQPFFKVLKIKF